MHCIKHIKQNNQGSAIVTVVVSMMFVIALGAALLFAVYTGYKVEITQRGDKDNFYDASSAMDNVRLGVQTLLSDSVSVAYTSALTNYFTTIAAGNDPQTAFNDNITAQLLSKTDPVGGIHYFTSTTIGGKTTISGYNVAAIIRLINRTATLTTSSGGTVATLTYTNGPTITLSGGTAVQDTKTSAITIKAISVKYVSASGYESNITTDIAVSMPYFFASSSVASSINNYAIIAHDYIKQESGGAITVTGSVFAGNNDSTDTGGIIASNGGNTLTFTKGDLICRGKISVYNSAVFNFNASDNELWANDINIGVAGTSSGTATLAGNVYVADDLALLGNSSSVTLINSYFGFGDDTTNSANSSSILVNGRGSTLNISGLENLSLAGVSFIETENQSLSTLSPAASFTTAIRMGQSLSVTSDQLAYLVPLKCITNYGSNPCVFEIASTLAPDIDINTILWGTGEDEKKLSDYVDSTEIKTLYKPLGDGAHNLVYVFLVFSDKESANTYFQDYFAADSTKISQYLSLYLTSLDQADKTNTAGNMYYISSGGTVTLNTASSKVYAAGAQLLYSKMASPYGVFVNEGKMDTLATASQNILEFTNSSGDVVAVVAAKDYEYDGSKSDIRLIISSKNVTVNDTQSSDKIYRGVIIAGTDVILQSNVTGELLNSAILSSTCTANGKTYKLSDFLNNSAQLDGSSNASEDLWNLDTLVYYENWTKS